MTSRTSNSVRRLCLRTLLTPLAVLFSAGEPVAAQKFVYPVTRKADTSDSYFGRVVADPFRWLEATDSAETLAWVKSQNALTFSYLADLPDRAAFRDRLTALWNYERFSAPVWEGGRYLYLRNSGLQNQSVLYVQSQLTDAPRVLLDPNTLSGDGTVALGEHEASPDGKYVAYATSVSGSDWTQIQVRDIATGRDLPEKVEWVKFSSINWTRDAKGFFYSRYPTPAEGNKLLKANKDHRIFYHRVGTPQSEDVQFYANMEHPEWLIDSQITRDGRYLLIYMNAGTASNTRILAADLGSPGTPDLQAVPRPLFGAGDATYLVIGNDGPVFYAVTNHSAPTKRIVAVDLRNPDASNWREIVPAAADAMQSAQMIGGRIVAQYLHDAASAVRFYDLSGKQAGELETPVPGTILGVSGVRERSEMFYSFTSFLYPRIVFRYDMETGTNTVFKAPSVPFDASQYETKQVFFASKDGTRVPMFVTARKGMKLDGQNPTLLYAYGGFNIAMTPTFNPAYAAWLERGGVYAQPSIRGGSEYGEAWHKAGMKENKQNVFDDFIAAAEYLIAEGYTSPAKLAINGISNGGLLVGAVANQRPELFAVALPAVGVLDMLRFHKFTIGWAWATEYGSSDDAAAFEYLSRYSPLHNVKPGVCYPATLVTTADHDDRVVPGHSFKYTAALQNAQSCDRPVMARIETDAGHGAGKPTSKMIEEIADQYAFAWRNLGMSIIQ